MQKHNIYVTKPYLPPFEEYVGYLKKVWQNQYLTNGGPLANELEEKLQDYLGVKHVLFVSNGTSALQLAIKALGITQEIITTPFTFAATAHSIVWEHATPRFVDIDPLTFCIDPEKIVEAITQKTQAIMPVHIYGIPCDVQQIDTIAKEYNLKVIYDAAHAFGVRVNNTPIFSYGDISTVSFHATKLFSTGEGGAVITNNDQLAERIKLLRNFGIRNDTVHDVGINAKNSELHAAYGLASLQHIEENIEKRKVLTEVYDSLLQELQVNRPFKDASVTYNYPYFPLVFAQEEIVKETLDNLKQHNIYAKRYFYPSLNTLEMHKTSCPVSEFVASRILCLPLYPDLQINDAKLIASIVRKTVSKYKRRQKQKYATLHQ